MSDDQVKVLLDIITLGDATRMTVGRVLALMSEGDSDTKVKIFQDMEDDSKRSGELFDRVLAMRSSDANNK